MHRRDFVQRLPIISTGLLLGAHTLSLTACASAPYLVPRGSSVRLRVSASSVPVGGAFVQRPGMERPIFVHRDVRGDYVALLARCTHRGCQPEPVGDRLVCPCHGSEFDLRGSVLEGPADRPLIRYDVAVDGDDLVILTDRRRNR